MADANDVLQVARDAFEDAHRNMDTDLADAKTPIEARVVQDNHDAALANYMETLRTAFELSDARWEQALSAAQQAKANVDAAREAAGALVQRLGDMTALTKAVANLIDVAK